MRSDSTELLQPQRPSSSTGPQRGAALLLASAVVFATAAISVLIAANLVRGEIGPVAALLPYLALLIGLWWVTKGNLLVLVLTAYLIGPGPADNLLPQVLIFPADDYALRPRDMFFLADLVLLAALVLLAIRPDAARLPSGYWAPSPSKTRWSRWWFGCLLLLSAYPVVVGIWFGAGQSVPAVIQGATMPLRAVAITGLVLLWVRRHGWETTVRNVARSVVGCGLVLALAAVTAALLARIFAPDQTGVSVLGYPLITDRRPALPGWGNNILSNYLCVCLATLVLLRHRMRWRAGAAVGAGAVLLLGLVFTEVRIAMLLSLLIVAVPMLSAVLRRLWPRRGAVVALTGTALVAVLLVLVAAVTLPVLNPRFETLTPGVLAKELPRTPTGNERPERDSFDTGSGVDLGGESFSTRGGLVDAGLDVWSRNPLLGTGWNGWGWAKSEENPRLALAVDPHNGLLWLVAETGVLGLLLLYAVPVLLALRRPRLAWLWVIPAIATLLELVNPNLRNGHFAVVIWVMIALLIAAPRSDIATTSAVDDGAPPPTPTIRRQWYTATSHAFAWLRGNPRSEQS